MNFENSLIPASPVTQPILRKRTVPNKFIKVGIYAND
jgi:hypothetical protein